jgi:citrate lyase beta subunit
MRSQAHPVAGLRSLLFTPGSEPDRLAKALAGDADAVVADLEDAVATAEKAAAREAVVEALSSPRDRTVRLVRINGMDTEFAGDDLAALAGTQLDAIVLPKAAPAALAALPAEGPPIVALVETAVGLRSSHDLAVHPRVVALMLGAADLGAELGLETRPDGQEILYARSQLVVDSAAAGIRAPFDVVHLDVRDSEGLEQECHLARSLGFRGKSCIHPAQVEIVNRTFSPRADEVDWARRVISAYEEAVSRGRGAVAVDGKMVDPAVVARARALLATTERHQA